MLEQRIGITCTDETRVPWLQHALGWASTAGPSANLAHQFEVVQSESGRWTLAYNGAFMHESDSFADLYPFLIERVSYHAVDGYRDGLALHAACVNTERGAILLPGVSGAGKSTVTAWLLAHGCSYLTDELVFVSPDTHEVRGWSRPLHIKTASRRLVEAWAPQKPLHEVPYHDGTFVAPDNFAHPVVLCAEPRYLLFPHFAPDGPVALRPLSQAAAALRLAQCAVNARHLPDHGIRSAAALARRVTAYTLHYQDAQALGPLLNGVFV